MDYVKEAFVSRKIFAQVKYGDNVNLKWEFLKATKQDIAGVAASCGSCTKNVTTLDDGISALYESSRDAQPPKGQNRTVVKYLTVRFAQPGTQNYVQNAMGQPTLNTSLPSVVLEFEVELIG